MATILIIRVNKKAFGILDVVLKTNEWVYAKNIKI